MSGKVTIVHNVYFVVFCKAASGTEGVKLEDVACLTFSYKVFSLSDDYKGKKLSNPTVAAIYNRVIRSPFIFVFIAFLVLTH